MDNDRIRAHAGPIPNDELAQDLCPASEIDVAAEGRSVIPVATDRDLMLKADIRAPAHSSVDHDSLRMQEHEAGPEFCAAANNACAQESVQLVEQHLQGDESPAAGPLHQA